MRTFHIVVMLNVYVTFSIFLAHVFFFKLNVVNGFIINSYATNLRIYTSCIRLDVLYLVQRTHSIMNRPTIAVTL